MSPLRLRTLGTVCLSVSACLFLIGGIHESFYILLSAWPVWALGYQMKVWATANGSPVLADRLAALAILVILGGIVWYALLCVAPLLLFAGMLAFLVASVILMAR